MAALTADDRPPAEAVEVLVLLAMPSPERARARRVRAKDLEAREGAGKRDSSESAGSVGSVGSLESLSSSPIFGLNFELLVRICG